MPHRDPLIVRIGVGGIFDPGNCAGLKLSADRHSPDAKKGTDKPAHGTILANGERSTRNAGKTRPGASRQPHRNGFELVILGVPSQYERGAKLIGGLTEQPVTRFSRRDLNAAGGLFTLPTLDDMTNAMLLAQHRHAPGLMRSFWPQTVINSDRNDLRSDRQAGKVPGE